MATAKKSAKATFVRTSDDAKIEAEATRCGFAPAGKSGGLRYFVPAKTPTKAQFKAMRSLCHAQATTDADKGVADAALMAVFKDESSRETIAKALNPPYEGDLGKVFTMPDSKGWGQIRNQKREVPMVFVFRAGEGPRAKRSKAPSETQLKATQEAEKLFG